MKVRNVIENWFNRNSEDKTYSSQKDKLIQIVNDFNFNLKVYRKIENKLYFLNSQPKKVGEIDFSDLDNCLLFMKLDEEGYKLFNNQITEFGFISIQNEDYSESEKDSDNFIIGGELYFLFNKLKKDIENRQVYSGIAEIDYSNYRGCNNYYIGTLFDNIKSGFGILKYNFTINQYTVKIDWTSICSEAPPGDFFTEFENDYKEIFYCGHWLNDMKHGLGIISSYVDYKYNYREYILIGKWENNKLVEIYNQNDGTWYILRQLIHYMRIREIEDFDYWSDVEVGEAFDISMDDISNLLKWDIEMLELPIIKETNHTQ